MTSPSTPSTPLPSRLGGGGGTTATTTYRSLWLSRIAAGSCRQNKWENYRKCTIFEGMLGIFFWTISQYLKDLFLEAVWHTWVWLTRPVCIEDLIQS